MLIRATTITAHIGGIPIEELALFAPYGAGLVMAARTMAARAKRQQRQTRDPRIP